MEKEKTLKNQGKELEDINKNNISVDQQKLKVDISNEEKQNMFKKEE